MSKFDWEKNLIMHYIKYLIHLLLLFLFIGCQKKDTWIKIADMPTARMGHSVCVVDGKIYAIGGALTVKPPHPAVSTVEVFIPLR